MIVYPSTMAKYDYTEDDLHKSLGEFYGCLITLENFGLTQKEYDDTEYAFDQEIERIWERSCLETIPMSSFVSIRKDQLAKCLLFIGVDCSPTSTLKKWLAEFGEMCGYEFPTHGNLVDLISLIDAERLFDRGW